MGYAFFQVSFFSFGQAGVIQPVAMTVVYSQLIVVLLL